MEMPRNDGRYSIYGLKTLEELQMKNLQLSTETNAQNSIQTTGKCKIVTKLVNKKANTGKCKVFVLRNGKLVEKKDNISTTENSDIKNSDKCINTATKSQVSSSIKIYEHVTKHSNKNTCETVTQTSPVDDKKCVINIINNSAATNFKQGNKEFVNPKLVINSKYLTNQRPKTIKPTSAENNCLNRISKGQLGNKILIKNPSGEPTFIIVQKKPPDLKRKLDLKAVPVVNKVVVQSSIHPRDVKNKLCTELGQGGVTHSISSPQVKPIVLDEGSCVVVKVNDRKNCTANSYNTSKTCIAKNYIIDRKHLGPMGTGELKLNQAGAPNPKLLIKLTPIIEPKMSLTTEPVDTREQSVFPNVSGNVVLTERLNYMDVVQEQVISADNVLKEEEIVPIEKVVPAEKRHDIKHEVIEYEKGVLTQNVLSMETFERKLKQESLVTISPLRKDLPTRVERKVIPSLFTKIESNAEFVTPVSNDNILPFGGERLIFTSENVQSSDGTLLMMGDGEQFTEEEISGCKDMGSLFEVSVSEEAVLTSFDIPTSTACDNLQSATSLDPPMVTIPCEVLDFSKLDSLTSPLPPPHPAAPQDVQTTSELLHNSRRSLKTLLLGKFSAPSHSRSSAPTHSRSTAKKHKHTVPVGCKPDSPHSKAMKLMLIQGRPYIQHTQRRQPGGEHAREAGSSKQEPGECVSEEAEAHTSGWEYPSTGGTDGEVVEGREEVVVLTPLNAEMMLPGLQKSHSPGNSEASSSFTLATMLAHQEAHSEHLLAEQKEKRRLAKKAQRMDPSYKAREAVQVRMRMRRIRSDPDFRKKERERDRMRRSVSRKTDIPLRIREKERDRAYHYYKRLEQCGSYGAAMPGFPGEDGPCHIPDPHGGSAEQHNMYIKM